MTDYAELKARLRDGCNLQQRDGEHAAAAIDALERKCADLIAADRDHAAATAGMKRRLEARAEAAEARAKRFEEALQSLFALNDEYSYFGGEIYQDRVNRTWERARAALQEDKSHE